MGSRGSFLESGGFRTPAKWHTVDYIDGIKVLAPKDPKASRNLPERSNTPGTAYIKLSPSGTFSQLRVFGADRLPVYDIDYGKHQGKKFLHVHFHDGDLSHTRIAVPLKPGDRLYEKYKPIFKGVK